MVISGIIHLRQQVFRATLTRRSQALHHQARYDLVDAEHIKARRVNNPPLRGYEPATFHSGHDDGLVSRQLDGPAAGQARLMLAIARQFPTASLTITRHYIILPN